MMPRDRCEQQHQAMPGKSMRDYLAPFRRTLPPDSEKIGITIKAILDHGLWLARCPMGDGCYGETVVTSLNPVTFCVDCGAGWFDVEFPSNMGEIEKEVMKRRKNRMGLPHANWDPRGGLDRNGKPNGGPETLSQLRRQRIEAEGE